MMKKTMPSIIHAISSVDVNTWLSLCLSLKRVKHLKATVEPRIIHKSFKNSLLFLEEFVFLCRRFVIEGEASFTWRVYV